jgi:hypothetical protein
MEQLVLLGRFSVKIVYVPGVVWAVHRAKPVFSSMAGVVTVDPVAAVPW